MKLPIAIGLALAIMAGGAPCLCGEESASEVARLVEGSPSAARIVSIDARWNVTLDTGENQRVVGAADLVHFGAAVDSQNRPLLVLADGGLIAANSVERIDSTQVTVWSPLWDQWSAPLEMLRGVILAPPSAAWRRDRLVRRIARRQGSGDLVLLRNGDELSGVLTPPQQADAAAENPGVVLKLAAGNVELPLDQIAAISFHPALVQQGGGACAAWMGLRDGSLLAVSKVTPRVDRVEVSLACGLKLSAAAESLWPEAAFLQPIGAGVSYLSDLPTVGYKQIPYLDLAWPYAPDGNVLGGRMRAGGKLWVKGLGMPSDARLAYDIPAGARRFQAEAAIDDLAGADRPTEGLPATAASPRGSVIFRVLLEVGEQGWRTAYESPVIRSGEPPLSLSVDLQGASRIALIVDRADYGQTRDYANWINARFVR